MNQPTFVFAKRYIYYTNFSNIRKIRFLNLQEESVVFRDICEKATDRKDNWV